MGLAYINLQFSAGNADKIELGFDEVDVVAHRQIAQVDEIILNSAADSLSDLKRPFNNNG